MSKDLRDLHREHHSRYILRQNYLQQEVVCSHVDPVPSLLHFLRIELPGTLFVNQMFLLVRSQLSSVKGCSGDLPKTNMFFSGNRFPLATPSSIDDHMSFLTLSPIFGGSLSLDAEICVYDGIRLLEIAMVARRAGVRTIQGDAICRNSRHA